MNGPVLAGPMVTLCCGRDDGFQLHTDVQIMESSPADWFTAYGIIQSYP